MKFVKYLSVSAVTAAVLLVPSMSAFAAGTSTLTLSASGSANVGTTVPVAIYENGSNINAVTANVSYDQSQLQYVGVEDSAAFPGEAATSGGNGSVSLTRFVSGGNAPVNGSQEVAVVDFKVLGGSGSTTVSTAAGSLVVSNGMDTWNGVPSSVAISLVTPVAAPAPTPTPAPVAAPKASTPATTKTTTTTLPKTTATNTLTNPVTSTSTGMSTNKKTTATDVKPATVTVKNSSRFTDLSALGLILLALIAGFAVTILRRRGAVKDTTYKISSK